MPLSVSQPVHYRYMSYPIGIIESIDCAAQKVLLSVDNAGCKFRKWVSVQSVDPTLMPNAANRFFGSHPAAGAEKN